MEKAKTVKTEFKCKCKTRLVIVEDRRHNVLMFGCPRCGCYLVIPEWRIREYVNRNFIDWRGLMKYAYKGYLDARDAVCQ